MTQVSVIIPNYNGMAYLPTVLESLGRQRFRDFRVILVDNGSEDESREYAAKNYPEVTQIALDENYGFSEAVNRGITASDSPYVLLLNNDTQVEEDFVGEMVSAMRPRKIKP